MWHIELVKNKYESLEDLYSLLQYVFRLNKTADDSRRANIITDDLTGCLPAMIPDINNPDMVYRLMLFRRHKDTPQLVRHAFASSLAKIGIIGGLGAFLAADAAFAFGSWAFLFGIGGQIALFANFLGPIGIVAGALISAGLGIMKLFGGGWEKSVAKKLVNAYEEKGVTDQYRKAINEYWAQTETAFDQAAEQLDQAWTAYVERLQTTVDSYDIEQIETSLTAAKGIQNFFEHIPL